MTTTIRHIHQRGLAADRPASANIGALYFATDSGELTRWSGTAWETYTPTATVSTEEIVDAVAAALVAGTGISVTYDDPGGTITVTNTAPESGGGLTAEEIRDLVAAFLVAGANVTLTHDDPGDTLTIAASGGGGGMSDPTTTKGDLIVRSATAPDRLPVGTDGQVLTADATQPLGAKWAGGASGFTEEEIEDIVDGLIVAGSGISKTYDDVANTLTIAATGGGGGTTWPAPPSPVTWVTGRWYGTLESIGGAAAPTFGTFAPGANVVLYVPMYVPQTETVDRIACKVMIGAAGTAQLGIYNNDVDLFLPTTRLLDAGTVDTSTAGDKEITISQSLTGGLWYWLAVVLSSASVSLRYSNTFIRVPLAGQTTAGAEPTDNVLPSASQSGQATLPATATPVKATGGSYLLRVRAA